jgi:hypothetical protein
MMQRRKLFGLLLAAPALVLVKRKKPKVQSAFVKTFGDTTITVREWNEYERALLRIAHDHAITISDEVIACGGVDKTGLPIFKRNV